MKINILSTGKFSSQDPYKLLFEEYKKRIQWSINLKELDIKQNLSKNELQNKEAQLIKNNLNDKTKRIVLDEKGKILSSMEFANKLLDWSSDMSFIIGGPYGHSQEVRNNADFILSFGKMTLPHMMSRVVLIEQIYRAYTIINHHPYHK